MSARGSAAQYLPTIILETVVEYVVAMLKAEQGPLQETAKCAILHCCQSWRAVGVSVFCTDVEVSINIDRDIACFFSKWPSELAAPSLEGIDRVVKKVQITIDSWGVVFSHLQATKPAWLQLLKRRFTQAREFRLLIGDPYASIYFSDGCLARISGEIDHLFGLFHQLVPNPKSVSVSWSTLNPGHQGQEVIKCLGQKLSAFAKGASLVKIHDTGTLINMPISGFVDISPLTGFSYTAFSNQDSVFELIRRNSPYLQTLSLSSFREANAKQLLYDENNVPVKYLRLQSLHLDPGYTQELIELKTAKEFVPFPALQRLDIWQTYPFGDDVVFRGNSDSLRHVRLPIYREFVAMCEECGIFTPEKFSHLRSLSVSVTRSFSFRSEEDKTNLIRSLGKIVESAVSGPLLSFAFRILFLDMDSLETVLRHPALSRISSLDLSGTIVRFPDVVRILQIFPFVRWLAVFLESKMAKFKGVSKAKLADYVIESYSGICQYLQTVCLAVSTKKDGASAANHVALLALIGPRLKVVEVKNARENMVKAPFNDLLKTRPFNEHAERLSLVRFTTS
ncbi:hypothetical protein LPJ75_001820 [Coemansia sp. RSA 2598]|nr:hypothetical protein LPJ75_001820 [Coemansia sp. RSA 2598]